MLKGDELVLAFREAVVLPSHGPGGTQNKSEGQQNNLMSGGIATEFVWEWPWRRQNRSRIEAPESSQQGGSRTGRSSEVPCSLEDIDVWEIPSLASEVSPNRREVLRKGLRSQKCGPKNGG